MRSCCEKFFAAKSIVSRLRKLFRRRGQNRGSAATAPDESSIRTPISRTAERPSSPTVDEDPEPRLADVARWDEPPLPPDCSRLQSEDVKILGDCPARAGAFTDIWDGSLAGERVAIKSYRINSTTDPTQARMRFHKEVLACTRLSHRNIVPFRAAYTTPQYPLALVYDFMGCQGLGEYLADNGGTGRVRLLADIAQGLNHMHDLDIIHGNLQTNNILVDLDGSARVAGLGSAFVPSQHHPTWSETDAELPFYGAAPELVRPQPPGSIRTTKESDVYAFALLAWELFAGQVPFLGIHQPAAFNLLATGVRPPRPRHSELSDRIWEVIQQCWHDDPCRRMPIKDVVTILEAEVLRNGPARCRL